MISSRRARSLVFSIAAAAVSLFSGCQTSPSLRSQALVTRSNFLPANVEKTFAFAPQPSGRRGPREYTKYCGETARKLESHGWRWVDDLKEAPAYFVQVRYTDPGVFEPSVGSPGQLLSSRTRPSEWTTEVNGTPRTISSPPPARPNIPPSDRLHVPPTEKAVFFKIEIRASNQPEKSRNPPAYSCEATCTTDSPVSSALLALTEVVFRDFPGEPGKTRFDRTLP